MADIRTYTITIGTVMNGDEVCANPSVELIGWGDAAVNCIDSENGIYQIQIDGELTDNELTFVVSCDDCHVCPPQIITKRFCDDNGDCGDCEICGADGFCKSVCAVDQSCVNGQCVDCTSSEDCPGNQQCINGRCQCPPGTTFNPTTGLCEDCRTDSDCDTCEVCQGGVCTSKDCGDDQVCDPASGQCTECVNSGDCGPNEVCVNGACECADGFTKVNGVCVALDCQLDSDCPLCFVCSSNSCIPKTCPSGKVPVVVGNSCQCVDECDCGQGGCADGKYCTESVQDGFCGCVDCQGDCDNGCQDPCVCSNVQDICIEDTCRNQLCTDGLDCGDGCGCQNGRCVPCESLTCSTTECDNVLGCSCLGSNCVDSDFADNCNNAPCEIALDCGFGCTCEGGRCVSCDNFSCTTSDCSTQDGCKCVGGKCDGDGSDQDCEDTLTLEKSDANCTLTGTLTKDQCCSCPEMTLNVRNTKLEVLPNGKLLVSFTNDVHKGRFDGVDATSLPKVDDTSNPKIADNEAPITGAIRMEYVTRYAVYSVDAEGNRTLINYTNETTEAGTAPYSDTGSASVTFTDKTIPGIGTTVQTPGIVKEVVNVRINFSLAAAMNFPNTCSYPAGTSIGTFDISSNTATLSDKAAGIQAPGCRLPLFKWYKSSGGASADAPFRKIYVSGVGNTFVDILDSYPDLESCKTYYLETDCSCVEGVSEYVVLCNPTDVSYTLSNCNKRLTFGPSFVPCDVNADADTVYKVVAGNAAPVTFTASSYPVGTSIESSTPIESVEFSIDCGGNSECTKTYSHTAPNTSLSHVTSCNDNGTFNVTFTLSVLGEVCSLRSITLAGYGSKTPDPVSGNVTFYNVNPGTYSAVAQTNCGCDLDPYEFAENCCDQFDLGLCNLDCDGNISGCIKDPKYTYSTRNSDGSLSPLTTTVAAYIEALEPDEPAIIVVSNGLCTSKEWYFESKLDRCCSSDNFIGVVNRQTGYSATITLYHPFSSDEGLRVLLRPTDGSDSVLTTLIPYQGGRVWYANNLTPGVVYDLVVCHPECGCTDVSTQPRSGGIDSFVLPECGTVSLTATCDAVSASYPQATCVCESPVFVFEIDQITRDGDNLYVRWNATLDTKGVVITSGVAYIGDPNTAIPLASSMSGTAILALNELSNVNLRITLDNFTLEDGCSYFPYTNEILVNSGGTTSPQTPIVIQPEPRDDNDKKVKFEWTKNGVALFEEYSSTGISTVPEADTDQGDVFTVSASCAGCRSNASVTFCCEPSLTYTLSQCNKRLNLTITGEPGTYRFTYGGRSADLVIDSGQTSITSSIFKSSGFTTGGYTLSAGTAQQGSGSCLYSGSILVAGECDLMYNVTVCQGNTYNVTLSNCDIASIVVNSGTYSTITNSTIVGIEKALTPNFTATVTLTNGCTLDITEGVDFNDPCRVNCGQVGYLTTSGILEYTPDTCTGATPDNDRQIILAIDPIVGSGADVFAISSPSFNPGDNTGANWSGFTYTQAVQALQYITAAPQVLKADVPADTTAAGQYYTVRIFEGSNDCYTDIELQIPETDCSCSGDSALAVITEGTPTCNGLTPNNNGSVSISNTAGGGGTMDKYSFSSPGAVQWDGDAYAGADALAGDGVLLNNISNLGATYILRVYAGSDACSTDYFVNVPAVNCATYCGTRAFNDTSGILSVSQDSCTAGVDQDDRVLTLDFEPAVGSGADKFAVDGPYASSGQTYAGNNYAAATSFSGSAPYELLGNIPADTSAAPFYIVRIFEGDDTCVTDIEIEIQPTDCSCVADVLNVTVTPTNATCNGDTELNNGIITLSGVAGTVNRYGISSLNANSYDGPSYPVAQAAGNGNIKTNVGNAGGTYKVKVFAGSEDCSQVFNVTFDEVPCVCAGPSDNASLVSYSGEFSEDGLCTPSNDGYLWLRNGGLDIAALGVDRYQVSRCANCASFPTLPALNYDTASPLPTQTGSGTSGYYVLQNNLATDNYRWSVRLYSGNNGCVTELQISATAPSCFVDVCAPVGIPGPCEVEGTDPDTGCPIIVPGNEGGLCDAGAGPNSGNCSGGVCVLNNNGACCRPNGTCFNTTAYGCSIAGGSYNGDGSNCIDVTCQALEYETCCVDASTGACSEVPVGTCNGTVIADGTCAVNCAGSSPIGACWRCTDNRQSGGGLSAGCGSTLEADCNFSILWVEGAACNDPQFEAGGTPCCENGNQVGRAPLPCSCGDFGLAECV